MRSQTPSAESFAARAMRQAHDNPVSGSPNPRRSIIFDGPKGTARLCRGALAERSLHASAQSGRALAIIRRLARGLASVVLWGALLAPPAWAATPWPLGVFIDNPEGSGATAGLQKFDTLMGANATILNGYLDGTQTPAQWVGNNGYFAGEFAATAGWKPPIVPLIGMPMGTTALSLAQNDAYLQAVAAGQYDSQFEGYVATWKAAGYATQYWRPGVEMNLTSTPGFNPAPAVEADWVKAFQRIYTDLHAAAQADGVTLKVIWNPGTPNSTPAGDATVVFWPGAAYVDDIGGDVYSDLWNFSPYYDWAANGQKLGGSIYDSTLQQFAANPINLVHYYNYPASTGSSLDASNGSSLSLLKLIAFAKAQNKPLAIPETGAGSANGGPTDNPTFPAWLASTLASAASQGVKVDFVSIWNANGGGAYCFTCDGSKPLEAAAWAANFGASAPPVVVTPPVVTPPTGAHTPSPANTQLPPVPIPPITTIYDTSGTAWTLPTSGGQIFRNGVAVPSSAGVVALFWTGTQLDQLNNKGVWWTQPLDGSAGVSIAAPAGYVAP